MHQRVFHACVTTSLWLPLTHAHVAASDLCTCSHLPPTRTTTFLTHVAHMAASLTLPTPPLSLSSPLVAPPPTIPIRYISYVMDEYSHNSPTGLMLVAPKDYCLRAIPIILNL